MIISKKHYDELNQRIVELAGQLRDKCIENTCLRDENKDLRHEKEEQHDALREVIKLTTTNRYNNVNVLLRKIKESAETAINS